jgi:hypothetical protein
LPARTDGVRHRPPRGAFDGLPHLQHGRSPPEPQVGDGDAIRASVSRQREDMGLRQVGDMDVVAHARPIRRREVLTKHSEGGSQAERRLDGQGDQMTFGIVSLADFAVGIGGGGVEIPKRDSLL